MVISVERGGEQRRNRVSRALVRTAAAGGMLAIAAVLAQQGAGIASADTPGVESVGWYGYEGPTFVRPLYDAPPPVYGPPIYTPPPVYAPPPPVYTAPQILVLPRSGSAGGGSSAGSSTGS